SSFGAAVVWGFSLAMGSPLRLPVYQHNRPGAIVCWRGMWTGIVVFGITYVLIAARRIRWLPIDRPAGALIGALLAVALGAVSPAQAALAVDQSTFVLLFAVMGMGSFLSADGFFERAAPRLAARARTRAGLLAAIVWGAGGLSALITNDAVCVLAAPV